MDIARYFVIAFMLYLVFIAGFEGILRAQGIHKYSLTDDRRLWSMERDVVENAKDTSDMVLLLGGSRMQLGFSKEAFRAVYPDKPFARLDVSGAKPVASLIDIAENTDFKGTILMAVYTMAISLNSRKDQQPYVDYYHKNWNMNAKINRQVKTLFEENLVSMNPRYRLIDLFRGVVKGKRLPKEHYLTIDRERGYFADYSVMNPTKLLRNRKNRADKIAKYGENKRPDLWFAEAAEVEPYVKKIIERGGKVVFIRFPVGLDDWRRSYDHRLPKQKFWDIQAQRTEARMIHFADYPDLQFDAPDGSHLDAQDASKFTHALLEVLQAQGVLN